MDIFSSMIRLHQGYWFASGVQVDIDYSGKLVDISRPQRIEKYHKGNFNFIESSEGSVLSWSKRSHD